MKTVAIYTGSFLYCWDEQTVANGMGGSETWAVEVSSELAKLGYDVTLFNCCETPHEVFPHFNIRRYEELFQEGAEGKYYDIVIMSRLVDQLPTGLQYGTLIGVAHDTEFLTENLLTDKYDYYCYLSEWHKYHLLEYYPQLRECQHKLVQISNGFSKSLYSSSIHSNKKNSTVWSSSLIRGFFNVYKWVYWPILKIIPDFKIYVCCGTVDKKDQEWLDRAALLPGVEVKGRVQKDVLANLQETSKIWIYPGTWRETFCITAIENAYAGNMLITPKSYGLATTLHGYDTHLDILTESNAPKYVYKALRALYDEDYRKDEVSRSRPLADKYSWEKAAKDLIKLFK